MLGSRYTLSPAAHTERCTRYMRALSTRCLAQRTPLGSLLSGQRCRSGYGKRAESGSSALGWLPLAGLLRGSSRTAQVTRDIDRVDCSLLETRAKRLFLADSSQCAQSLLTVRQVPSPRCILHGCSSRARVAIVLRYVMCVINMQIARETACPS